MFPLPIFYVTQSLTSDSPEAIRRIMAGTFVYGAAFTTGVFVGQGFAAERFSGTLKLLVTMPVSKMAYVFGSLLHSSLMGTATVIALLAFALIAGVDMRLTWAFLPAIALTVLCLTGLTLFTISFAPSLPVANIMAGFLGVVLTLISPVYFTMDQAPLLLRWLGYVSPLRYAADAITESLSGSTDIWIELAVLSLFALGAMFRWPVEAAMAGEVARPEPSGHHRTPSLREVAPLSKLRDVQLHSPYPGIPRPGPIPVALRHPLRAPFSIPSTGPRRHLRIHDPLYQHSQSLP